MSVNLTPLSPANAAGRGGIRRRVLHRAQRPGLPFALVGFWLLCAIAITACSDSAEPDEPAPDRTPDASADTDTPKVEETDPSGTETVVHEGERRRELGEEHPLQGRIVLQVSERIGSLNPATAIGGDAPRTASRFLSFALLTEHPEEIRVMPWLAASLPEIESGGRRQIWTIREGARWPDGEPIVAEDALFTWELLRHPELKDGPTAASLAALGGVTGMKVVDERSFAVELATPGPRDAVAFGLNFHILPRLASPKEPKAFAQATHLPGSGPYAVANWSDDEIVLERDSNWWGDEIETFKNRFRVKTFVIKRVADSVQVREQLKQGHLDFAAVGVASYLDLRKAAATADLKTAHYFLPKWSFIGWNCKDPLFADERVRRALSHLIPRKLINDRYYDGLSRPVSGPFLPDSVQSDPRLEPHRFSPSRAKTLLTEAGWTDSDGDGRLDRDGRAFEFTLDFGTEGKRWSEGILTQFKEALHQVGIGMTLDGKVTNAVYGGCIKGESQAYILVWNVDAILPDLFDTYHSQGAFNWTHLDDPDLDALLVASRSARDDAKLISTARKIHRLLHEKQPMSFLFNNPSCVVWNERVHGVHCYPLGVREWDFYVED